MTEAEMDKRLAQLRGGFDIAIEKTLRHKVAKHRPVVICPDGKPMMIKADKALEDFLSGRNSHAQAPTHLDMRQP